LSRFPLIPEGYVHPEDFDTTFGFKEIDPIDPNEESLFYSLTLNVIDLSGFEYESLTFVSSIQDLEDEFNGNGFTVSFVENLEAHDFTLTITRNNITESIELYDAVAVILFDRFEEDSYETDVMEELKVSISFDTFVVDIWVLSLISNQFETFNSFSMSFYMGINPLPV
jgi:hypothetical protein